MPRNPYAERLREFPEIVLDERELDQSPARLEEWGARFRSLPACSTRVLEIGCSNAEFLSQIALKNREAQFIGNDWKYKVIYKGSKRVASLGVENLLLFRGNANRLSTVLRGVLFDEIWIFFPDPWAKKSQKKNRIFSEASLLAWHEFLKPGGRICFKTDHPGYFQWALALLGKDPALGTDHDYSGGSGQWGRRAKQESVRKAETLLEELPPKSEPASQRFEVTEVLWDCAREREGRADRLFDGTPTLFERVFLREGLPIFYLELKKRSQPGSE